MLNLFLSRKVQLSEKVLKADGLPIIVRIFIKDSVIDHNFIDRKPLTTLVLLCNN